MPRRKKFDGGIAINMTPMIDVVFQLIIFFIVTLQLDREMLNEDIELAHAPHGPEMQEREPGTVIIEINARGSISIGTARFTPAQLHGLMRQTVARHGARVPVLIRGDRDTPHENVRWVMDACSGAGIWRMKFAAVKEKAR